MFEASTNMLPLFCSCTGAYVDIVDKDSADTFAPSSLQLASADVFQEISQKLASAPGIAEKVKAIFLWNINKDKKPAAEWSKYVIS